MGSEISPPIASRIDKAGTRHTSTAPIHEEKFTQKAVGEPRTLALQLTRFAAFVSQLAQLVHSNPIQSMIVFEDVPVTAGTPLILRHGLGRRARYSIVRWVGAAAAAHNFQYTSESADFKLLTLTPLISGTADIAVWGQQ